jgi:hypothetical protein
MADTNAKRCLGVGDWFALPVKFNVNKRANPPHLQACRYIKCSGRGSFFQHAHIIFTK